MPEFTDNLRTTKVLLTKFGRLVLFAFACMLARSSVVYDGARCSIARECIFPPEIVFMDAIREYFTSFVEQRVLFKFHDEKFFVATQIALIASRSVSTRMFQDGPFDFVWAIAFLQTPYVFRQFGVVSIRSDVKRFLVVPKALLESCSRNSNIMPCFFVVLCCDICMVDNAFG